jgi:hypothetical protein
MLSQLLGCSGVLRGICALVVGLTFFAFGADADEPGGPASAPVSKPVEMDSPGAEREAAFCKMLSGATLEGSFTSTGDGANAEQLSREKYTLGEVKKLQGNMWFIPARIQYGEHDVTIPLMLPVRWAGDTPVIVVDEVGLPGFGTVSARVMFFADHYAGYWKHGKSGGHLFGVITREKNAAAGDAGKNKPSRSGDSFGDEQEDKKAGE